MSENGRHIACTSCRTRKIKCDGGQPRCQRCFRYGEHCVYTSPSRQKSVDVSSALKMFNERLSQSILPHHYSTILAKIFPVQAETSIAARQDGSLRAYSPTTSAYAVNDINAANWPEIIPSNYTFQGTGMNSPLSQSWSFPPATTASVPESTMTNSLPSNNFADRNISNILMQDSTDQSGMGEAFSLSGDGACPTDQGYRRESPSCIWPLVDTPSSSERPTTPSASYDTYETVPQAVMNDL